jgi:serine/threonine-protein kinase
MTPDPSSPDPAVIGRYQVVRTIGQGGMGAVYLAKDPAIDRLVALKLMRTGFDNSQLRERFAREARAAGRLHHPNIVTIFEYGEHQGEPFIAMEYIEGQTLSNLVGRPDVTVQQILALMDGVAAGLFYAHRAGVIHRDIKPVNLMVDSEGIVKILDFGIARAAELSMTYAGTQPGTIIGTLNYMAPEQLAGKPVDHRADIFSVGAVFYELLAGRQAFPGELPGVLHMIMIDGPASLVNIRPDLDPAIVAIVNRCLERNVEQRYPDLGAMRRDLAAVRQSTSVPDPTGATVVLTPVEGFAAPTPPPGWTPKPGTPAPSRSSEHPTRPSVSDEETILVTPKATKAPTAASLPTIVNAPPKPATPVPVQESAPASAVAPPAAVPTSGGRRGLLLGVGALVLVGAIAAAYVLGRGGPKPVATDAAQVPAPSPTSSAPAAAPTPAPPTTAAPPTAAAPPPSAPA